MSTPQSRIAQLASTVAAYTQKIDDYLTQKSLPQPSFNADGPIDLGLPADLQQLRGALLDATQELNDLLQGPRDLLFNHHHSQLLYLKLISRFDIAKKVPINGEITYKDLAASVNVEEGALSRILRLGIAHRIFREPRPGVIAHSAASRQIADDPAMADWVSSCVEDMWPSAEMTVDALAKWPLAEEPNQTLKITSGLAALGGAMSFFTSGEGYSLRHLTDGYAWSAIGAGTVVDLGGSFGEAAFAIARQYPDMKLIVQDLPEVTSMSKEEPGLSVEFMAHDFFTEQPVKDADILRALVPALKSGSRVLIMDFVMPPPLALPNLVDRELRAMDATMLEIGNAKERNMDEWKVLFQQTDRRFVLKGTVQPPGSNLTILELEWQG
ncbi:putative O-methyltransferase [Xylaria venustula]|nr:putative O-methyltransferase [Xylaria venustula]